MITAIGLTVSKLDRAQRGQVTMKYTNNPQMQFRTIYTVELECVLNGLPWQSFVLSKCFYTMCQKNSSV